MAMNKNVIIVLAGGLVVAVLAALLVQATLSGSKKKEVKAQKMPTVMIAVASKPIKMGEAVTAANAKWQSWPQTAMFDAAIVRQGSKPVAEQLSGKALRNIVAGEPIMKHVLVPKDSPNFLAAALTPGMKAVAIPVSATSMAGGFIAPGDRVDIILTYSGRIENPDQDPVLERVLKENFNRMATETIMQNVKVLAVDQRMANSEDGKIKIGKTITVEVDQRGAEKLVLARKLGDLSLALRSLGDETQTHLTPLTTDERLTSVRDDLEAEVNRERQNGTGQTGNNVRIYTGSSVQQVRVTQ